VPITIFKGFPGATNHFRFRNLGDGDSRQLKEVRECKRGLRVERPTLGHEERPARRANNFGCAPEPFACLLGAWDIANSFFDKWIVECFRLYVLRHAESHSSRSTY
jgi:hypothetical protein